jgi:putative FmdB family regulatory protein
MPLYDYYCPSCKEESERVSTVASRAEQTCDRCGFLLKQLVSLSADQVYDRKFDRLRAGKYDEGLGRYIESRSHKKKVMKEMGVIEVPGYFKK